ncbi:GNAT family N-acetyltransferase [Pseudomonas sp. CGJS7]|uniref:GNAT family N-acetyltransferase n=1 Tax=Pseudomonas sp. CGJS7 TaxID=3109348 RepID=UPI00300A229D
MSADHRAYTVAVERDIAAALARWREWSGAGSTLSLFQSAQWLDAWYATLGAQAGREALLVSIARRDDGRLLMALPLIRETRDGLVRIAFADCGVSDYAAPLWTGDCPDDPASVQAMFKALRRALPRADLWSVEKMPEQVDGRANPLRHLPGTRESALFGNPAIVGEDFEAWRFSREKTHRKELERSWRVFTRHPDARLEQIVDVDAAMRVMDALETHQRAAISGKGWAYILDEPGYREFYRRLIEEGLAGGEVVLTALMAGEEVVAALLGLRRGGEYAMIRIGNAAGEWRNCSPGRLVIERTMAALHAQGVRRFDFTIGDYAYKRGFMPDQLKLFDSTVALSWKGLPRSRYLALRYGLKRWLAERPRLRRRLEALRSG